MLVLTSNGVEASTHVCVRPWSLLSARLDSLPSSPTYKHAHAHAAEPNRAEPPCTRVHDAAVSLPIEGRIRWGGRRIYGGLFEVLAEGTFPRKDLERWVSPHGQIPCIFERVLYGRIETIVG